LLSKSVAEAIYNIFPLARGTNRTRFPLRAGGTLRRG
jgi:hypothetical protein